jgi:hypothetical protein
VAVALVLAMLFTNQARARADQSTPEAFLHTLYDHYAVISQMNSHYPPPWVANLDRYFAPSLVALINKDWEESGKLQQVPILDGDPLVDAQEWQISEIKIQVQDMSENKATGVVSFKNDDLPVTVIVKLVKLKGVWKIDDILYPKDPYGSLRGMYKNPSQ